MPLALLLWRGPEDLSIPAPTLVPFRHPNPAGSAAKAAPEASPAGGQSAGTDVTEEVQSHSDAAVQPATDTSQLSTGTFSWLPVIVGIASSGTVASTAGSEPWSGSASNWDARQGPGVRAGCTLRTELSWPTHVVQLGPYVSINLDTDTHANPHTQPIPPTLPLQMHPTLCPGLLDVRCSTATLLCLVQALSLRQPWTGQRWLPLFSASSRLAGGQGEGGC